MSGNEERNDGGVEGANVKAILAVMAIVIGGGGIAAATSDQWVNSDLGQDAGATAERAPAVAASFDQRIVGDWKCEEVDWVGKTHPNNLDWSQRRIFRKDGSAEAFYSGQRDKVGTFKVTGESSLRAEFRHSIDIWDPFSNKLRDMRGTVSHTMTDVVFAGSGNPMPADAAMRVRQTVTREWEGGESETEEFYCKRAKFGWAVVGGSAICPSVTAAMKAQGYVRAGYQVLPGGCEMLQHTLPVNLGSHRSADYIAVEAAHNGAVGWILQDDMRYYDLLSI